MVEAIVVLAINYLEAELMRWTRSFNMQSINVISKLQRTLRSKSYLVISCVLVLVFAANLCWAAPPQAKAKPKSDNAAKTKSDSAAKPKSESGTSHQPNPMDEFNKYPGLIEEFGVLLDRFQREIKMPPARTQSHLLRMMPQSTTAYGAFPNYGAAARQALEIFQEELKTSTPLRDWWQHSQADSKGPGFETVLKRYYEFSEYLGDEVVGSATIKDNGGGLVLLAEVKKPGVEQFLRSTVMELAGQSTPTQVLNPKELATAKQTDDKPVILVRPDVVIFSTDLKTLRSFNAKLGSSEPTLDTTAFGARLAESYQKGAEILMAADLETMLAGIPKGRSEEQAFLQQSGVANVKYAIWEYANVTGQAPSRAELTFLGPRRGFMSWLAAPAHLSGLDFVSPDAALAMSVRLKNPAEIFADIKELSASQSPQGGQNMANIEPMLMPILTQLTGEITVELHAFPRASTPPTAPEWKVIIGTKDVEALRQSLSPLLAEFRPRQTVKDGETYYSVETPDARNPMEINFTFQQGNVVIGSSQQAVMNAVQAHRSGESLGKSEQYRTALPPGHTEDASAIMYQNSAGYLNAMLSKLQAGVGQGWLQPTAQGASVVNALYGEETAIRQASNSGVGGVAPMMIVAAIAIPNLLRSRIAANEASAVGAMRTLNTAQVTYEATYPEKGFARDLATLGGEPGQVKPTAAHAYLLDSILGCSGGTAGNWCTKSGYKFTMRTSCTQQRCGQYVTVATPVSTSSGQKSFCSTVDAVIRYKVVPPLTSAISASECKSWEAIR